MVVKLIVTIMVIGFALFIALGVEIYSEIKRLHITDDDTNNCFKDVRK